MLWLRAILLGFAIFAQALAFGMILLCALTWLLPGKNKAVRFAVRWLSRALDPLLIPLRRFLDARLSRNIKLMIRRLPIDITPLLAMLILAGARMVFLWLAGAA